jgi:hypothetical protein
MNIARPFSSKRKENVIRVSVMFRVVSVFRVAGNLSSLRMSSVVRCTRRRKDKIAEERFVGSIEEGHENVRAFAGGNEEWTDTIWRSAFVNHRRIVFERVPMMDVSRGLGQLVRNEKGSVMSRKIAYNAMQRAINTIAQSIVEEIAGINFDAGGIM